MANNNNKLINEAVQKYSRTHLYRDIKKDLNDQLERNCTTGKYYSDLVEDYMSLWITKCLLFDDIKRRGVSVEYKNGENQHGHKKNDSIEQSLKVNAQMLKILSELGIKPSRSDGDMNGKDMEM